MSKQKAMKPVAGLQQDCILSDNEPSRPLRVMLKSPLQSPVPVLCAPQDVDAVREQIDKEIQDLGESIRWLKTRRNMLAPISRLPNELLYKIFTTFAFMEQKSYIDGTDISWIRPITAVCSHWRAVALECPLLWSTIIFSRPCWAAEMLKRSKMAPLIINADLTYLTPKLVDAVQMALQHISRIRELRLTASKATMEKLINNLNERAPMLQSLSLSNPRYSHFLLDDGYTLPDTLFDGDGHRLQRLELAKCNIRWDSPLLNNLTHIKIHKTSMASRPTLSQLLGVLEKMPRLETLDMEDSLPVLPQGNSTTSDGPIVNLPFLSLLRLAAITSEVSFVLRHLSYPATTSLRLYCYPDSSADHNFSSIYDAISMVGSGSDGSNQLQSLIIQSNSPKSIRIVGWLTSGSTNMPTTTMAITNVSSPSPHIDLELNWYTFAEGKSEAVFVDICHRLQITKLQTLSIYHLSRVSEDSWLEAFAHLTSLRSINVRGPAAFGLVLALSSEIDVESDDESDLKMSHDPPGVFAPKLQEIAIEDTDFGDDFGGDVFFDDLLDCLIDRIERNAEIQKLSLIECTRITEDDVALLREIVVDVDWDGVEQDPDYEDDDGSGGSFDSSGGWGFPFFGPGADPDEMEAEFYSYGF